MKQLKNFLILLVLSALNLFAQPMVGDYMSVTDSTWSTPITWTVWNGSAWIPATSPPTGSENITILNAVNIDVTVNISGYVTMSTAGDLNITTGSLIFGNGSTYEHAINSGSVPIATWGTGSTCKFTGITSQAPGDRNQSYYNLIWNCPNQSGNLNMGFDNVTIGGNINIISTGASSRWYLCGPVAGDSVYMTINGNIVQTAGQFSSQGTGNGQTLVEIIVQGNISVTGGNFACTRGSQGGTGTTNWILLGENFSMSNATTQNSNTTDAKFLFSGTTQQNLTLNNVTFSSGFPVEVASNAILDVGMTQLKSSGIFTLNDGATLQTANPFGLDSTLQTTGVITLSTAANYTFNGISPQLTGTRLPAAVNNFVVNNSQGVTPSQDFTANGNLTLTNGDLHLNGGTITLGPVASLIESAGNTVTDVTGKLITTRDINAPSGINIGGMGAMLTTSAILGSTTIERYHFAGTQDGENGIFRVFNIIPTNNTGLNATLRYYFDESELNGLSEANLRLFKSASSGNNTWTNEGGNANASGNYVELAGIGSFSYWTLFEGATTFQLTVNVANGWNMVSIPGLHPVDQNVSTWWAFRDPGANVFKYAGGYQSVTTVTPGQGYWMKHSGGWIYIIPGIQIVPHTPLTGASGWNLIGGYELSVTAANVTTNPPGLQSGPIYKYSGGYQTATTIDPGYGYWIKLNAAGQIIIPETMAKGETEEYFAEDWGRIILTDATGINYTLYAVKGEVNLDNYELPPAPPTGMFDIRFNSGRIAEDINSSIKTIDMSGVTYPLTVRVEGMDIRLMDETGKAINVNLKAGEDIVISDATINKLMVSRELIPAVYALEQNYPNPFNPSTVIEFSLPENVGNVKLSIYNALGEKVAELVNTALTAGKYLYQWNASNVATGMYIYELRTDNFVTVKKMLLLK